MSSLFARKEIAIWKLINLIYVFFYCGFMIFIGYRGVNYYCISQESSDAILFISILLFICTLINFFYTKIEIYLSILSGIIMLVLVVICMEECRILNSILRIGLAVISLSFSCITIILTFRSKKVLHPKIKKHCNVCGTFAGSDELFCQTCGNRL